MSQDKSVHPLDQDDDDEAFQKGRSKQVGSPKKNRVLPILAALVGIFLLITLAGTAMINASPNSESDRLGGLLWQFGAVGMLICCFAILATVRRHQLMWLVRNLPGDGSILKNSWVALLLCSLVGLILVSLLLAFLHLVFGSLKVVFYLPRFQPFFIAIVLAFIGSTYREVRAFWIGFATLLILGTYGYDVYPLLNRGPFLNGVPVLNSSNAIYPPTPADPYGNPPNPIYGTGRGLGINVSNRTAATGLPGYRFEFRMLLAQLSTVAYALLTGLLCSGLVALSQRGSALKGIDDPGDTRDPPQPGS